MHCNLFLQVQRDLQTVWSFIVVKTQTSTGWKRMSGLKIDIYVQVCAM